MQFDMINSTAGNPRQAFTDALFEEAQKNPDIVVLTSDATGSAALAKISAALPKQFVECGIAEQDMVGIAAGIANFGKRPFVCSPAAFLSARALEQIKVDVAYSHQNVKLVGVSGGISYGALGESHYSVQDFAIMRAIAGITVLCPSDPVQAAQFAHTLSHYDEPAYLRMGRGNIPIIYDESDRFEIGKAYMCRNGYDVSIVAVGELVYPSLVAAEKLAELGISARVLDMFTVKPLDREAIISAAHETGAIVTAEEHCINGGLGSAAAQLVCMSRPVPVESIALPNEVLLCGSPSEMKEKYGLSADNIVKAAIRAVRRKAK